MNDLKLSLIITADGKAAITGIQQVQKAAEGVGSSAQTGSTQAGAAFDGLSGKVGALSRNLGALLGISFGAVMVKEAVMVGDAYNVLQSRIQDATRATGNYAATSQAVFEISQKTGTVLSTSVSLYQSLARSAGELGAKQADVLKLQETVQKLGVVGGSSTSAMNAGLLQFGQMLAGGVAHAEEMNSLLENIPAVAEAIAKGMGMTTGQLRAAVLEGKVLSQDVMRAILSQSGDVDARFKAMPLSIERATTELNNAWSLFMGNLLKSTGAAEALAKIIENTAKKLEDWGKALDPAKQQLLDAETIVTRLSDRLRASEGQGALYRWMHGSNDTLKTELNEAINNLIALQDQASAFGSKGASAFNAVASAAKQTTNAVSDVMRSVMDLNNELKIQLAMGDASRAHMQAYRAEAKLQSEIDKALAEGKADLAFSLEEERAGVMAVNAENIRLQGTLDAQNEAHKEATRHVRAHSVAKRELAKETRDYARESERAIDFIERENQAIHDTSERLLKLAAEYGNSDAKAILYQRQLDEVTRALEAMGATADEVKAAQQRLWEEMTTDGQAAKQIREANEKAAKDAADEWKRQSDEIERSLTDALMRGFEGGKGFAENLVDTLKNMFNTLVLRPIIQAIVQPVAGAATSAAASLFGGGGTAGVGSMAGLVQNGSNLMGMGGSALIGSAASWLGTTAFGGTAFGGGMVAGLAGAGGGLMSAAGAFSAGASMMASGSVLAGLGTIVGAAIPVIGWVVAIASLLSSVLGGRGDQTPDLNIWGTQSTDVTTDWGYSGRDIHTGGGYESGLGRVRFTTQHNAFKNEDAALQFQQYMEGFGISEDMIAKAVGEQVSQTVNDALQVAGAYMKIEEPDDWTGDIGDFFKARFTLIFDTIGGDLNTLFDQFMGEVDFADPQQVAQLTASIIAINTATGDFGTVLRSLADPLQTDFAAIKQLAAEGEILPATMVRLGAQLMSVNDMVDALGGNMLPLNQAGVEAANALIELAGGMDKLTAATNYFYENFYTEEERRARVVKLANASIGDFNAKFAEMIAGSGAAADGVIDTREELRAFVESLDLTTEAGRAAYLAAMALAPSIVAVTNAMNAAGSAAHTAAKSMMQSGGPGSGFGFQPLGSTPPPPGTSGGGLQPGSGFGFQPLGDTTSPDPVGSAGAGSGVPDIGGWQPWHDTGSAAAGTGGGTVADLSAQLADFMAGIRDGLDRLQLSDFDYSLRALGLEFDALRAKAEALGASAEDMALIDELEGLRESELRAAEAARLAADAARAAAGDLERVGALGSAMNDVQDQLAKLQLSDTDYALRELSINMAALRAQIIALGGSAEDLALVDQLEALRLAQIEAAAAAEAARQAEEAQAEAERQAREQAEAAYEALATAEKQAQQELDALADEMEEFNRAVQSVRDDIAGSVLSILRDQPGWSEADYQRQRINQLRQRIDQASGLEQIALIGELQEAILARYQAERAELEQVGTQQTDLYSAMEQAHQAELQHYQDVEAALKDLAKYVDSLKLNDQLSTLTPFQKLEEAQRQFYATLGLAQGGDAQAIRDLTGAASAYLQDARAYFASGEQYTAIFDAVTQALEALTGQNVAAPMGEDEWRDFMASLQSTQTEAVVDLSGIQDQALHELQALDELLNILTGEQALAAQEQQAAILETLQEARDTFASFAGEMPEDLAQAAEEIGAATDNAAERITTAITGAIQSMDQHLADTNAQVSANTQAIAGLQAQLAALAAQNAALQAQNAALQAQLDSNTANLA